MSEAWARAMVTSGRLVPGKPEVWSRAMKLTFGGLVSGTPKAWSWVMSLTWGWGGGSFPKLHRPGPGQ